MTPKISPEVEQLVSTSSTEAIRVEGANGKTYWLLTPQAMKIRDAVLEGLEEADRGEMEPWDSNEIKTLGRQQLRNRPSS